MIGEKPKRANRGGDVFADLARIDERRVELRMRAREMGLAEQHAAQQVAALEADRRQVIGQAVVAGTGSDTAKVDQAIAGARLRLEEKNLGVVALETAIKDCEADANRLLSDDAAQFGSGCARGVRSWQSGPTRSLCSPSSSRWTGSRWSLNGSASPMRRTTATTSATSAAHWRSMTGFNRRWLDDE
jgi:hypothetical protein